MAFLTWPLMGAVQMMCARIGMVTGEGLAAALHAASRAGWVGLAVLALLVVNTMTVGPISGMADAMEILTHELALLSCFRRALVYGTLRFRYQQLANILKWLALGLVAYVVTAFSVSPHWKAVAHDSFIPTWPRSAPLGGVGRRSWDNDQPLYLFGRRRRTWKTTRRDGGCGFGSGLDILTKSRAAP
jgi:Mn2+/Fe2+ NRAMP family transporter